MDYFKNFPVIKYNNTNMVDISRRIDILSELQLNPYAYVPYTIEQNDRPEDIAYFYYGSTDYTWIIYLVNNIMDIYEQWPLSDRVLGDYIRSKYKAEAILDGVSDPLEWSHNTTLSSNIVFYRNVEDRNDRINKDTYDLGIAGFIAGFAASDWEAIRVYDYEDEINFEKRNIYLINRDYAEQLTTNMKATLAK